MKIETKYREGLRQLMKEKPLDEINVVMLCDAIKSNRQTFYYHYRDIADVIESMFLKERVGYGVQPDNFDSIIRPLIAYINNNYSFLYAVASSFASDKLSEFLYSYFYQRTLAHIKMIMSTEKVHQFDVAYITRYIGTIFAKECMYWINNKRKERQVVLQKRLFLIWDYFINFYSKEFRGQ